MLVGGGAGVRRLLLRFAVPGIYTIKVSARYVVAVVYPYHYRIQPVVLFLSQVSNERVKIGLELRCAFGCFPDRNAAKGVSLCFLSGTVSVLPYSTLLQAVLDKCFAE